MCLESARVSDCGLWSSRADRPRARAIAAALLICVGAAVRPIAALLLGRFERKQRAIIRELGQTRMVDRDESAFESRIIAELRQLQAFNRRLAFWMLALDERLTRVEGSVPTLVGLHRGWQPDASNL